MNVVKEKENLRKAIGGSMYKKCEMILKELEAEGKLKVWWDFNFPEKQPLKLKLKDMLEDKVDEKYYLQDTKVDKITNSDFMQEKKRIQEKDVCDTLLARDYKDPKCVATRIGGIFDKENKQHQAGSIWDIEGISPTLDTMQGGYRQPCIITQMKEKFKIRKLTPREVWRLMGFNDEEFEKAAQVNSDTQLYKQARKFYCC